MQNSQKHRYDFDHPRSSGFAPLILGAAGCFALAATFILATSDLESFVKTAIFLSITALFVLTCLILYLFNERERTRVRVNFKDSSKMDLISETENKLLALDEADQYFGTSLKPSDMFMLVSSRMAEIFPFVASALFVPEENGTHLKIVQADGKNAQLMRNFEKNIDNGLAGRAAISGALEIDEDMTSELVAVPSENLEGFRSSAAIPLIQNGSVFGVLQFYTDYKITSDKSTIDILETIGRHAAPIFRNSIAFEQSLSNALTDSLTNLPNERAFFMILESQLAESQRYRDERPLTVLAIDIKDFSSANLNFGHAAGDQILEFAAKLVREHLRKMDFLARSINDEYVVILPTASEKTAVDIVERIKAGFAKTPFEAIEGESINVLLNFGLATFWKDGETAPQLLQNARLRKQQAKSAEPNKVLWFPKEYVN